MPTPNPWDYADKSGKEHAHQAALFMWANMAMRFGAHVANFKEAYTVAGWAMGQVNISVKPGDVASEHFSPIPQLKWLHAIHNQGHGDVVRGNAAKAEGVKAGVFDLFLPVPAECKNERVNALRGMSGKWYAAGFYLEMKVGTNNPSPVQEQFKADMLQAGYHADVAWGWLEARNKLLDYLGFPVYTSAIEFVKG